MKSSLLRFLRRCFPIGVPLAGALAIASGLSAQPESTEPVVMLPPLTVTDRGAPLQWRYLQMPGLEILTVCDDSIAVEFAQRLRRLDDLLRVVLPARFTAKMAVPETIVMLDEKTGQARSREVLADMVQNRGARVRFMPNLRLVDLDATGVFAIVRPATAAGFTYASDRIAFLLERRVPHLPDWFIHGMLGFYSQLDLKDRNIEVRPAVWLSPAETLALSSDAERPRTLLPMAELFSRARNNREASGEMDAVWRAQSALFVRWATVENKGANKEALWKFLDRLEKEPPSETLFRELFGLGYADARDELSDYLTSATQEKTTLAVPPTARQRLRFRPATDLEIARIRGDWERMEIAYVRQRAPTYVDKYIEQAQRTLNRAYSRGEKDPRLLAALGLTEIDAGNPGGARLYLEAAVAGNVVRPRAYYELARLRYEATLKETGREEKFSASRSNEILAPLLATRSQEPPLPQVYALLTNVMARSSTPPTAEQLAMLHEGARDFPQISELVLRATLFHLASGQPAAAATLLELGLSHAYEPEMRAKLERLRDGSGSTE